MAFVPHDPKRMLYDLLIGGRTPVALANADFETSGSWAISGSWFINSGILGYSQLNPGFASQQITAAIGTRYLVRYNVTTLTVSGAFPEFSAQFSDEAGSEVNVVAGTAYTSEDGWLTSELTAASANPYLQFTANDVTIGIDEVEVFQVALTGTRLRWLQILQSYIGDRIYSNRRPQAATQLPCAVISVESGAELIPLSGSLLNVTDADIDVILYAHDPDSLMKMYSAFRGAFHGYRGSYGGDTIQRIHVTMPPFDRVSAPLKGSDRWMYRTNFEVSLAYEQTVTSY